MAWKSIFSDKYTGEVWEHISNETARQIANGEARSELYKKYGSEMLDRFVCLKVVAV